MRTGSEEGPDGGTSHVPSTGTRTFTWRTWGPMKDKKDRITGM